MEELKGIQDLINEKASKKLHADIREHLGNMFPQRLNWGDILHRETEGKDGRIVTLGQFFDWASTSDAYKMLYEANIKRYIEIKSKAFVDSVMESVPYLSNQVNK